MEDQNLFLQGKLVGRSGPRTWPSGQVTVISLFINRSCRLVPSGPCCGSPRTDSRLLGILLGPLPGQCQGILIVVYSGHEASFNPAQSAQGLVFQICDPVAPGADLITNPVGFVELPALPGLLPLIQHIPDFRGQFPLRKIKDFQHTIGLRQDQIDFPNSSG